MGEIRNAYNILFGKPERKTPPGRPRRRREDNTGIILRVGSCGLDACGSE
jgi:hypothetical protein